MNANPEDVGAPAAGERGSLGATLFVILIVASLLGATLWYGLRNQYGPNAGLTTSTTFPVGVANHAEPSGESPPLPDALRGYKLAYVNDFLGTRVPSGWFVFNGVPGGEPGGFFGPNHVTVGNGLLTLHTFKDPRYAKKLVTGGLCQCGLARTYGAYFVRSRLSSLGPNEVELLWPQNNQWPPEIDFNESGSSIDSTSSTVHYSSSNYIDQRGVHETMNQWHTWGVIWSPSSISYIVDGHIWGKITNTVEIPAQPMTLDFEQRTLCNLGRQCPSQPVTMDVDWVAEYVPSS